MKGYFNIEVRSMDDFAETSIIAMDFDNDIKVIIGVSCDGEIATQSFEFNKKKWTQESAKEWAERKITPVTKTEKLEPVKKIYTCELKSFNDEELSFEATASTNEVDRDGDILRVNGWTLKNFKKNPVMLWGHNMRMLPIGRAENVRKENDKLVFKAVFTPADLNPLGEQIYNMYKAKFINAFSVRFDPFEWKIRESPEDGGKTGERFGREYTKMDLLEISPVGVPALATALINRDFQSMLVKCFQYENSMLEPDEAKRKEMLESKVKICVDCGKCKEKEEKSGRVLSSKNRALIRKAILGMGTAGVVLEELIEATESQAGANDEIETLKEDLEKISNGMKKDDVDLFIQNSRKRLDAIEGGK